MGTTVLLLFFTSSPVFVCLFVLKERGQFAKKLDFLFFTFQGVTVYQKVSFLQVVSAQLAVQINPTDRRWKQLQASVRDQPGSLKPTGDWESLFKNIMVQ